MSAESAAGPLSHRALLSAAAFAIEPLLNRLVFSGRQVAEFLMTGPPSFSRRPTFATDGTLRALSSARLDRVATDLQRLNLTRASQTATSEFWNVDDRVVLEVVHVTEDEGDATIRWLQYAILLTVTVPVETARGKLLIRLTGAPALLALDWDAHRTAGQSPLDSAVLADLLGLVAGRAEVVDEVLAAPKEIRAFIRDETRRFLSYDGAELVVLSALPRTTRSTSAAARVVDRLQRMAE